MRLLVCSLFSVFFLLPADPLSAQPKTSPIAAVPSSPVAGFWSRVQARIAQARLALARPAQPARPGLRPGEPRAAAHTANPSCLPGALQAALADLQLHYGAVSIISTHRPGARIRGGRPSLHASCRAVDFKPAPGTYAQVAAHLRRSWNGGVGTYSSGHIHIDLGDNYRWHAGR